MKKIKKTFLFWGCLFFLTFFYIKNLHALVIPSICFDEIGYWANAAFWNGQNWSGVMGNLSPYYSYGYSIILFLLMKIFRELEELHQAAVIINIFMIAAGYGIVNYLAKWIFPQIHRNVRYIVCVAPFFYPSIQFHTQTAWSETYLCLLFLISVVLIKKLQESEKTIYYLLFGITLINLYITHQRNIVIVFIGVLHLLFFNILKKNRWRQFIIFMTVVTVLTAGSIVVKKLLQENVYTDTTMTKNTGDSELDVPSNVNNYNDYSGQIEKIRFLFSREGICNFVISYAGKLYYFMLASFFLGGVGIWHIMHEIIKFIRLKNYDEGYFFVYSYTLTAFFGTMAVAALFMIYPNRIDTVAYGRYTDCLGTVILIFGIFKLVVSDSKVNIKIILIQIIYCLVFLMIFERYIIQYHVAGFYSSCSPIMGCFNSVDKENMLKLMTLGIVIIGVVITCLTYVKKIYLKSLLISAFSILVWIVISNQSIEDLIYAQYKDVIYSVIECIEKKPDKEIYYLYNDMSCRTSNIYTGSIQYLMQGRILYCITDIESVKEKDSLVIICEKLPVPEEYDIECETRFYKIIRRSN